MSLPVILDCDPGCDDAIALLMAMASPKKLRIEGITTVAGNVSIDAVQKNARRLCDLAGRYDIKVFKGCEGPMVRHLGYPEEKPSDPNDTSQQIHGLDGLAGLDLPDPDTALQPYHAVDFLRKMGEKGLPFTLCATGPLTNIAMALRLYPPLKDVISEIIWMGGSMSAGNVTPSAEFNAYCDAYALRVVLDSGIAFKMFGLDVTHQVCAVPQWRQRIKDLNTSVSKAAFHMMTEGSKGDADLYGLPGKAIHDACAVAYLLDPDLFKVTPARISVDASGGGHHGHTTVSFYPVHISPRASHMVAQSVNTVGVQNLILSCLSYYADDEA